MGARYGQKVGRVQKWLHSNALADPSWTIRDPPLQLAIADLTSLMFYSCLHCIIVLRDVNAIKISYVTLSACSAKAWIYKNGILAYK